MMNKTTNKGYLNTVTVISFLFLLGAIFPAFSANTHLPLMWPAFAFMFVIIVINQIQILISKAFILIIFYFALLITYSRLKKDSNYIRSIYIIIGSMIVIRVILAILTEKLFPGASRGSGTAGVLEEVLTDEAARIGVGGYVFMNALPFVILPLMFIMKTTNSNRKKVIILSLIGLLFYSIIVTSWGTALIISFISFIIGFFLTNQRRLLISTFFLTLMIIVVYTNSKEVFLGLSNAFSGNQVLTHKINDIQESFETKQVTGQVGTRSELYNRSLSLFRENPIFGSNKEIGGHAFFIDHLARYGIVGTFLFLLIFYFIYKENTKIIPKEYLLTHQINIVLFFVFGCVKNLVGFEFYIFLFVFSPFMINYWFIQKGAKFRRLGNSPVH